MKIDSEQIKAALAMLDPEDDAHWTSDGLPRMDVVESILDDKSITRQDVTDADPEFCRETAKVTSTEDVAKEREEAADGVQEEGPEEREVTKLELDEQIQDMNAEIASLEKARDAVARERDRLQQKEYGGHTAADDTKARLAYIHKQHALRMERAGRRAEVLKHIRPGDIAKGSQLDNAMARKTGRGTQRPQRPPL